MRRPSTLASILQGCFIAIHLQKFMQVTGDDKMRRLLGAFALCCALTMSAYAGDISCGRTSEPVEVRTSASEASGEISCGVLQAAITFILSVL
jgi:hypothetical protein